MYGRVSIGMGLSYTPDIALTFWGFKNKVKEMPPYHSLLLRPLWSTMDAVRAKLDWYFDDCSMIYFSSWRTIWFWFPNPGTMTEIAFQRAHTHIYMRLALLPFRRCFGLWQESARMSYLFPDNSLRISISTCLFLLPLSRVWPVSPKTLSSMESDLLLSICWRHSYGWGLCFTHFWLGLRLSTLSAPWATVVPSKWEAWCIYGG